MTADEKLAGILAAVQTDPGDRGLARVPGDNLFTATAGDFERACRSIAHSPADAGVAVMTGFYIPTADPPASETDGPLGSVQLAGQVMPSTWTFFTMEMYQWDESQVGISLTVVGVLVAIVQAVLIGKFVKKFGSKKVILMGFIFWTVGMISFCFASNPVILYIALIPYVLGGIAGPSVQGIVSNSVSEKEQGNLQGALAQVMSLTAIIGPLLYTALFARFSGVEASYYFPGAPYMAAAIIILVASVIAFFSLRNYKDPVSEKQTLAETVNVKEVY